MLIERTIFDSTFMTMIMNRVMAMLSRPSFDKMQEESPRMRHFSPRYEAVCVHEGQLHALTEYIEVNHFNVRQYDLSIDLFQFIF